MTTTPPARTVMLYATVDTFRPDRGHVPLALSLCEALGASLTGVLLNLDANIPPGETSLRLDEMNERFGRRAEANRGNAEALVQLAARRGVGAETVCELDHSRGVIGCLADHARLHDIVVIGSDDEGMMSDRLIAESLLFETGRPMLLAPAVWSGTLSCRTIVVAWDNTRVAARALFDALTLLRGVDEVVLLMIGGEKAIRSSLDEGAMARTLGRRGKPVRVVRKELRHRSIGAAIQEEALELGADLLVMGGYGHSRLRDFILGGATLSVLGEPRLPVLLSH